MATSLDGSTAVPSLSETTAEKISPPGDKSACNVQKQLDQESPDAKLKTNNEDKAKAVMADNKENLEDSALEATTSETTRLEDTEESDIAYDSVTSLDGGHIDPTTANTDIIDKVHIKQEPKEDIVMASQVKSIQPSSGTKINDNGKGKGIAKPADSKHTKSDKQQDIWRLKQKRFQLLGETTKLQQKKNKHGLSQKETDDLKALKQEIYKIQADLEIDYSLTVKEIDNDEMERLSRHVSRGGKDKFDQGQSFSTDLSLKRKLEGDKNNTLRAKKTKLNEKHGRRSAKGKKKRHGKDESAVVMCSMSSLAMQDSIHARAGMGELPSIQPIIADNVKDQMKKLRQLAEKHTDANKKHIDADLRALKQAKLTLQHKYEAKDGLWLIKGMSTPLYHYQFFGASWMVRMERSTKAPQGGLLADTMGLGKTLQVLACILAHPPTKTDETAKLITTLVVVPPNIVDQWVSEIHKHCPNLSIILYTHANNKRSTVVDLSGASIILISFSQLVMVFSEMTKPQNDAASRKGKGRAVSKNFAIFQMKFYRIILDEAHEIKNHRSLTSQACLALSGKYRWAMTGTPTPNKIEELYPYMRFIGAPGCDSRANFKKEYCRSKDLHELDEFLRERMLRRSYKATFLHEPLFVVPLPHPLDPKIITLSAEEELVYRWIDRHSRRLVAQAIKNYDSKHDGGNALDLHNRLFEAATRLRQAAAHPFLLEMFMTKHLNTDIITSLRNEVPSSMKSTPIVDMMEQWCVKLGRYGSKSLSPGPSQLSEPLSDTTGDDAFKIPISQLNCPGCFGVPRDAQQAKCGHVYCAMCLTAFLKVQREVAHQDNPNCPRCLKVLEEPKPFEITTEIRLAIQARLAAETVESNSGPQSRSKRKARGEESKPRRPRRRGDDWNGIQPREKDGERWTLLEASDKNIRTAPMPMSSKVAGIMELITEWQTVAPDDKIIVFTEYIEMGRIIGRAIEDSMPKVGFVYYFGEMSLDEKEKSVSSLNEEPDVKIFISSLRAGGQGLNLNVANRVIITDLWWNLSVEQQAFCRVFRIGQSKETYFIRIMVENSIDERIKAMQDAKMKNIELAMQEFDTETQLMNKETLLDMFKLFGKLKPTEDGHWDIESDYIDEDPGEEDDSDFQP